MHTHLTKKSSNPKTGTIPVSTTEAKSCPPSCPLNDGTCYAKHGHLAMHWKKVSEKLRGESFKQFIIQVEAMATGTFWRHNQAGDLAGSGDWIDIRKLKSLVAANKEKALQVFDAKSYEKVKDIPIGDRCWHFSFTPDDKQLLESLKKTLNASSAS